MFYIVFRPDGEKKAYVRLAPDYDALDVANKVSFREAGQGQNEIFSFEKSVSCKWCKHLMYLNVCDAFKGTTDARHLRCWFIKP